MSSIVWWDDDDNALLATIDWDEIAAFIAQTLADNGVGSEQVQWIVNQVPQFRYPPGSPEDQHRMRQAVQLFIEHHQSVELYIEAYPRLAQVLRRHLPVSVGPVALNRLIADLVLLAEAYLPRIEYERSRMIQAYRTVVTMNGEIGKAQDPIHLYHMLCEVAVRVGGMRLAWVGMADARSGFMRVVAQAGDIRYLEELRRPEQDDLLDLPLDRLGVPALEALHQGQPQFINRLGPDLPRIIRRRLQQYHLGSGAALPIRVRGRVEAVFAVYHQEQDYFDAPMRGLLKELIVSAEEGLDRLWAQQAELAAHREQAQLAQHLRDVSALNSVLAETNQILPTLDSSFQVYETVCRILVERGKMALAWVGVPSRDGFVRVVAAVGETHYLSAMRRPGHPKQVAISWQPGRPESLGPTGHALMTGQPQFVDVVDHPPKGIDMGPWRDWLNRFSLRSSAALPIRHGSQVAAVLTVYHRQMVGFNPELQTLLKELVVDIEEGIRRIGLQRSERVARQRLSRTVTTLLELQNLYRSLLRQGDTILQAKTADEILTSSCERLVEGGLFLVAWVGQPVENAPPLRWRFLAIAGPGQDANQKFTPFCDHSPVPPPEAAWQSQQPVSHPDLASDPVMPDTLRQFFEEIGGRAAASIPLRRGGQRYAVLTVISAKPHAMTDKIMELLSHIGDLMSHGLDALDARHRLEQSQQQAWDLAHHDPLTGLPNRLWLADYLPQALKRAEAEGRQLAVGMIDLDDFKTVNDTWGHDHGDRVLQIVAQSLSRRLAGHGHLVRLGGDEWLMVLEPDHTLTIEALLKGMSHELNAPIPVSADVRVKVGASAGIAYFPDDAREAETLIRLADIALYQSKAQKGQRSQWVVRYQPLTRQLPEHQPGVPFQFTLDQVVVVYQPIVDLATGAVQEVEALARLQMGERMLGPAEFLTRLSSDEQYQLSLTVLEQALSQWQRWYRHDHLDLMIGVNFAASDFLRTGFVEAIASRLEASGVPPQRLVLEILEEDEFLSLPRAKGQLASLKHLGVQIALDDMGRAYASLFRLAELPIDIIKIDQGFMRDLERHPHNIRLVAALMQIADFMRLKLVIEGVETVPVRDAIRLMARQQVPAVQGYVFSRPVPPDEIVAVGHLGYQIPPVPTIGPDQWFLAYARRVVFQEAFSGMVYYAPGLLDIDKVSDLHACHLNPSFIHDPRLTPVYEELHREMARWASHAGNVAVMQHVSQLEVELLSRLESLILTRGATLDGLPTA
ncbi:MAG: EAL domain-containing protein [Sulfobacillus thermotolerans]|nr:EAL domain-containing protein [Sulfobacillus thermotolerans]